MPLLIEADYEHLQEINQAYEEDEPTRSLILRQFALPEGVYAANGTPATHADVLFQIPANYNLSGSDMFWVSPYLTLADGSIIPNANEGADPRTVNGQRFERWSRHWGHLRWEPRVDNVETLLNRLVWALHFPKPQER